jgi:hypothetical protein
MTALRKRCLRMVAALTVLVSTSLWGMPSYADEPRAATIAPLLKPVHPYWPELTQSQRQALTPLNNDWERLDTQTKKKWVEIANRYPKMKPEEQSRSQERMREWAMLTPDQRRVARDSYARVRAMPPEQRADMLRKYQELPQEKKQALATEGKANKALVVPKPILSPVPVPRRTQMSEGAKVRNPAVAAQKSASPVAAPSRAVVPSKDAAASTLSAPVAPVPDATAVVPAAPPAPTSVKPAS